MQPGAQRRAVGSEREIGVKIGVPDDLKPGRTDEVIPEIKHSTYTRKLLKVRILGARP